VGVARGVGVAMSAAPFASALAAVLFSITTMSPDELLLPPIVCPGGDGPQIQPSVRLKKMRAKNIMPRRQALPGIFIRGLLLFMKY
jgi:hypothetical protein